MDTVRLDAETDHGPRGAAEPGDKGLRQEVEEFRTPPTCKTPPRRGYLRPEPFGGQIGGQYVGYRVHLFVRTQSRGPAASISQPVTPLLKEFCLNLSSSALIWISL